VKIDRGKEGESFDIMTVILSVINARYQARSASNH